MFLPCFLSREQNLFCSLPCFTRFKNRKLPYNIFLEGLQKVTIQADHQEQGENLLILCLSKLHRLLIKDKKICQLSIIIELETILLSKVIPLNIILFIFFI